MKKMVLLIDSSDYGGIESHVLQLSLLLKQKKRHCLVLFLNVYRHFNAHPLSQNLTQMGIPFFYLNGQFRAFQQFLNTNKNVYLIHAHGYKAILWARFACLYRPIACLSTYHAGEKCIGKLAFYQYVMYKTGFLSKNFAVSHPLAIKEKAIWLPNFISLPKIGHRIRHTRLQVAFVGRNDYVKGLDRFLYLSKQNRGVDWHVFGCDGQEDNVHFHGKVLSMENYWRQLDLLIIPSRAEGLPMVALEAMGHQVPVFSTRVGELPQVLEEGWTVEEPNWRDLHAKITELSHASEAEWAILSTEAQGIIRRAYLAEHFWEKISLHYEVNDNGLLK